MEPPRGRGKGCTIVSISRAVGITPRTGGEKLFRLPLFQSPLGSPPRRRGKAGLFQIVNVGTGDHPRMGGEKQELFWALLCASGSPPHGRGKVVLHCGVLLDVGITPAWAGKSRAKCKANSNQRDHPRVGGEKPPALGISATDTGSPPRGRGKVLRTHPPQNSVGITPAWAGKCRRYAKSRTKPKDHPRVGGEK